MSTVIDDVRVLLQTTERNYRPEPVDASRVVADEIRKLETKYESVVVEASIPERATVRADDLLARIFRNLLSNAVEHNDAATPWVSVTADPGPDTVRFEIADNGPGIPDSELDSLFERVERRGSTHGLGLYLVSRLTARYDGTVELADTGPDGSRFAVELPAVSSDGDAEPLAGENASATAPAETTRPL
ncbi:sensor histidine kinase [Natrinema versiforme]|uniref:histidine kinase n=1 Tax=Natrinema versiforme JCM 10478 TaxID=1227496 RepID=L9XUB4_9EURY|nr:ATP-binding protein [Natrinema versiforme]ELY65132.1 integral membrane sensor signal transduction histidine kinase [Natrinema versiforme JCM 10478]